MTGRRIRQTAALLMIVSVLLMLAERLTGRLSEWLGQLRCGLRDLEPVDGIVGENSCGFDDDMMLMALLGASFLLGLLLYLVRGGR